MLHGSFGNARGKIAGRYSKNTMKAIMARMTRLV